jgi:hypothetical protein
MVRQEYVRTLLIEPSALRPDCVGCPRDRRSRGHAPPDRPAVIEWRSDVGPIRLAGGARIRHNVYVAGLVTSWRRR